MEGCYEIFRNDIIRTYGKNYNSDDIIDYFSKRISNPMLAGAQSILIDGVNFTSKNITKANEDRYLQNYPKVLDSWKNNNQKILNESIIPDNRKNKMIEYSASIKIKSLDELNNLYKALYIDDNKKIKQASEVINEMFKYI